MRITLNELRNLVKNILKEEKVKKEVSNDEKEKWATNYFKYYDEWMVALDKMEKDDERIMARKLYNQRQDGEISKAEFQSAIAKKSKGWGI